MSRINQPINQVKLTNVAVVRCNRAGKRFEIACYRNKVMDYRAGLETDLSEVLQTDRIFTNVSKGQFAKAADLEAAFGTRDQEEIAKIILEQSDKQAQSNLQVSDLERAHSMENAMSQIATWVAAHCVNSDGSDRPFTVSQIKHALGKNYMIHPHKPIKKQCLDAVKFLKTVIPIERAKMELQLQYPSNQNDTVQQTVLDTHEHRLIRRENGDSQTTLVIQVDPSLYREISDCMTRVDGSLEILEQIVISQQGDMDLEQQLQTRQLQKQETIPEVASNVPEEEDSEVEELVDKLQNIRGFNDDGEHRKPEKKNRKKSKKEKRRELEQEEQRMQRLVETEKRRQQQQQHDSTTTSTMAPTNPAMGTQQQSSSSDTINSGEVKSCNTCGGIFTTAASYRAHFRSDWHLFNQKLKLKGIPAVSEQEFLLCDADSFFIS